MTINLDVVADEELEYFLKDGSGKYAVISTQAYYNFPVAYNLAQSPRMFNTDKNVYTIISLNNLQIPLLVAYIKKVGFDIEYQFTEGTNRVTLLHYYQMLQLLAEWEEPLAFETSTDEVV